MARMVSCKRSPGVSLLQLPGEGLVLDHSTTWLSLEDLMLVVVHYLSLPHDVLIRSALRVANGQW